MSKPKVHDPRGSHSRFYHSMHDSPAWNCLSATDQRAYMVLLRQLMSFNNGDLSLPITYAKHYGITSETTLAKNLRALQAVGLIAVTVKGAHKRDGSCMPNLYRLTDHPTLAQPKKCIEAGPATNDWRSIKTKAEGLARIAKVEAANKEKWRAILADRQKRRAEGAKP